MNVTGKAKPIGYLAEVVVEIRKSQRFKSRQGAQRYLERVEARLKASNAVCDDEIWTNIELIYLTRWDCSTARLTAAESGQALKTTNGPNGQDAVGNPEEAS